MGPSMAPATRSISSCPFLVNLSAVTARSSLPWVALFSFAASSSSSPGSSASASSPQWFVLVACASCPLLLHR